MYYLAIRQFARTLRVLDAILAKAERYAAGRGFDVNQFIGMRLAPDMLPFVVQVRIACDHAKNAAANLSGKPAPKHEDDEKTFTDLHARIGKALAFIESLVEKDFEATPPDRLIALPTPKGKALRANDYLLSRQIPNFFFHVTTAYAILRHGGVDLGKTDLLGPLELVNA